MAIEVISTARTNHCSSRCIDRSICSSVDYDYLLKCKTPPTSVVIGETWYSAELASTQWLASHSYQMSLPRSKQHAVICVYIKETYIFPEVIRPRPNLISLTLHCVIDKLWCKVGLCPKVDITKKLTFVKSTIWRLETRTYGRKCNILTTRPCTHSVYSIQVQYQNHPSCYVCIFSESIRIATISFA